MADTQVEGWFLFVFMVSGSLDFWVPVGDQYLRFGMDTVRAWLVRRQSYLPAGAVGFAAQFSSDHRRWMEHQAGHTLPFYRSLRKCEQAAAGQHGVYGLDNPAGTLDVASLSWRGNFNDGDEE